MNSVSDSTPVVVLLRGLGRHSKHWSDFPERLATSMPAFEIRCVDLPGFGVRSHESSPLSISEIVDSVIKANHFENRKVIVVGYSLGGMVALNWAERYPAQVMGIVLINSSAASVGAPWQRMKPSALLALIYAVTSRNVEEQERRILGVVSNDPEQREKMVKVWAEASRQYPVSYEASARQLYAAARFSFHPNAITAPGVVIASRKDRLADYNCSLRLAEKLKFEILIQPDAGHDIVVDNPEWLAAKISGFANSL